MAVSQPASCSSIDLAGLPAGVLEALSRLVAVCREPLASAPCAGAFEEAELACPGECERAGLREFWGPGWRAWTTGGCGSSGPGSAGSRWQPRRRRS